MIYRTEEDTVCAISHLPGLERFPSEAELG